MHSDAKGRILWGRVIGQERVKQTLLSALKNDRLSHAYLFHGNEGVGKDAIAIELARVLQCETGEEEACGRCSSCLQLNILQHPNVRLVVALPVGKNETSDDAPLEKLAATEIALIRDQIARKSENPYHRIVIPKATIIKINSIRELRRESAMSTVGGRRRVFIISSADEMGDAAANTLLKTLEEPSGNTILILTTAHPDALLPTIRSRCQQVRFDPLTETDIRAALVDRNNVDPTHAALVARLANGSYTEAMNLLQDNVAARRQEVVNFVRLVLGSGVTPLLDEIGRVCSTKDRAVVVRFLTLMLMWFRDALVLSRGGSIINLDQHDDLQRFVTRFPHADLLSALSEVEKAISLVHGNVYINLVLTQLSVRLKRCLDVSLPLASVSHVYQTQ